MHNAGSTLVAIIGSFKQHYDEVLRASSVFRDAGWIVTSPAGTSLTTPNVDFVRFASDAEANTDSEIQSLTLRNIFRAQIVYVVAPSGYVGRTTCYEIGRLLQVKKPVYFSTTPMDLPVEVPPHFVVSPTELVVRFASGGEPRWLFEQGQGLIYDLERELAAIGHACSRVMDS